MAVGLKYGLREVSLNIPESSVRLAHTDPLQSVDPENFKTDLLSRIHKIRKSFSSVGIVVSDKTRLCEYPVYLPLLTEVLEENGLNPENITFYIAYGTHASQTDEECITSYGETYNNYRFIHHNSREKSGLNYLGTTSRSTKITINKAVLKHDLVITFGAVLHHYFAGYGGGRKLLFPGLAGYESILHNHQLFLDFKNRQLQEDCQSGNLDSNPLAMDLEEISAALPDRLEVLAILNSRREVCELHLGANYNQFRRVCDRYDQFFNIKEDKKYDMVVASAGGYPKDINFIQAHKSIHNAASYVKDGGVLILLAECIDGIGNPTFMKLFKLGGWNQIFEQNEVKYENNAATALSMMHKTNRIRIHFVTSLDEQTCILMGAFKTSFEETKQLMEKEAGDIAWIENASLLYH